MGKGEGAQGTGMGAAVMRSDQFSPPCAAHAAHARQIETVSSAAIFLCFVNVLIAARRMRRMNTPKDSPAFFLNASRSMMQPDASGRVLGGNIGKHPPHGPHGPHRSAMLTFTPIASDQFRTGPSAGGRGRVAQTPKKRSLQNFPRLIWFNRPEADFGQPQKCCTYATLLPQMLPK